MDFQDDIRKAIGLPTQQEETDSRNAQAQRAEEWAQSKPERDRLAQRYTTGLHQTLIRARDEANVALTPTGWLIEHMAEPRTDMMQRPIAGIGFYMVGKARGARTAPSGLKMPPKQTCPILKFELLADGDVRARVMRHTNDAAPTTEKKPLDEWDIVLVQSLFTTFVGLAKA